MPMRLDVAVPAQAKGYKTVQFRLRCFLDTYVPKGGYEGVLDNAQKAHPYGLANRICPSGHYRG